MTFFDRKRGLALSDPVGGKFRIISTADGGRSWQIVQADMPAALPGEFAFAASGQVPRQPRAASTPGSRPAAVLEARVFRTDDRGLTWTGGGHPDAQRPERRHLRARVPRPETTVSPWAATSPPDLRAQRARADSRRRRHLAARRDRARTSTGRASTGSPAATRSRSGRPAATRASTRAAPGIASTVAASTRSTARTRARAGPPARRAAPRT